MAAILKFKMATKKTTYNFPSAVIAILNITNIGIATILSSLGNAEADI